MSGAVEGGYPPTTPIDRGRHHTLAADWAQRRCACAVSTKRVRSHGSVLGMWGRRRRSSLAGRRPLSTGGFKCSHGRPDQTPIVPCEFLSMWGRRHLEVTSDPCQPPLVMNSRGRRASTANRARSLRLNRPLQLSAI